ncbi:hypothetical protein QJS10_CPA07g01348 [Acorus calamus]|uniref:Uncharacterized protein n=1 Tax=Acorus calamus TaxID=4465 RepID=A0AAV9EG55_ACOCL|nr:hypothetical protein QJS10_CPA07g01348 [Acorus calamus]
MTRCTSWWKPSYPLRQAQEIIEELLKPVRGESVPKRELIAFQYEWNETCENRLIGVLYALLDEASSQID